MKKHITTLEFKWALIFFIASLLWMWFEKQMGWHDIHIDQHAIFTNLFAIVAIAIYAFALINKRNQHYYGFMSWKQGFTSGVVITIIITLLTPISQFITTEYITPNYFKNAIEYAVNVQMMDRTKAEQYFNHESFMVQSTIFSFVIGLVTSAVIAFFVKRKPPTD